MDPSHASARTDRESDSSEPAFRRGNPGRSRRIGHALAAPAQQRFGFLQFDIAGALGLADGRYLARKTGAKPAEEVEAAAVGTERVLVIQSLGRPPKVRKRPGRRPGREADPPAELIVSRVTAVFAERTFGDEESARQWMRSTAGDEAEREAVVQSALGMLNRALHALAVAEADPYIGELSAAQPLATRLGHGLGPELAEGNFSECLPLPTGMQRRRRRADQVGTQERVAAILSGKEVPAVCETFLLRARADLNAGRDREAAHGLAIALDTLLLELDGALADPAHTADLSLLRAQRTDALALSQRARIGELTGADSERVADLVAVCERVLRRRRLLHG